MADPYKFASTLFFCLFLFGVLVGCQPDAADEMSDAPEGAVESYDETQTAQGDLNSLSAEEQSEGWQLLFNGEDLDQWRGYKMEEVPEGWTIQDNSIYFDAEHGGEGHSDLVSREQFADFDLKLDWKISKGGNSGVFYRATEDYEQEFMTGPEVQVIDASPEHYPTLQDTQRAGANYGLHPPSKDVVKPAGEWNQMRILVDGAHVEHWLNGEKVVEYELWTDEWKKQVSETKFAEWSDYGMMKKGHIVLQDHGAPVWYRNVRIKPLNQ